MIRRNSSGHAGSPPKKRLSTSKSGNSLSTPVNTRLAGNKSIETPPEPVFMDVPQNNDEAEKKLRQLDRLQQKRGISSPAERRASIGVAQNLTNQQLSEHYSKCIQLSTDNKINVKNAFNLQLIDYMTEMMRRKDSDMKNFQMASVTLDASAKIYAYRVDSIHTDTLKMAGGLGRTQKEEIEETGEEGDVLDILGRKKKKKNKRAVKIEKNMKNITMPSMVEVDDEIDPLFKKQSSMFDESRSSSGMFLTSLQIQDDTCQIILDSSTVINMDKDEEMPEITKNTVPSIPHFDNNEVICPEFAPFKFGGWNPSMDDSSLFDSSQSQSPKKDKLDTSNTFDMNAIPEPIDEDPEPIEPFGMDDYTDDVEDANEGTVITVGGGGCHQAPRPAPPLMETIHLKEHLANAPLEYSYFDTRVMSAWAGPGHWKLKPLVKAQKASINKDVKKKKENITLGFVQSNEEIEGFFEVKKASTKLSFNTVKQWNKEKTTLPVDLHYDMNKFSKLYLRPNLVVRKQLNDITEVQGDQNKSYEYDDDPGIDDNYGGDMEDAGANDKINMTDMFGVTIMESQPITDTPAFSGDNLVSAPNRVAKININYARTAKKMDMKKLKNVIWDVLADPLSTEDKENDKRNENQMQPLPDSDQSRMDSKKSFTFGTMLSGLQPKLTSQMKENLSVPLAFIALLHLANEHNLKLKSIEDLGDFAIDQD